MQTERQNANDRLLVTAKHAMRLIVIASFILASSAAGARAADPDVGTLVAEMKSALEPARPSVRKLTMRVSNELGESEPLPISLPSIGVREMLFGGVEVPVTEPKPFDYQVLSELLMPF